MVSKLPNVGTTIFTVMSALAKEHGAINLSQGFPDFDCDPRLPDLAYHYMKTGHNQYPPMRGIDNLLEQIGHKYQHLYGRTLYPAEEITVTVGAAEGIYSAITTLVGPADEVIILDPAYDLYKPAILINGGVPVIHSLRAPDFAIDWQAVRSKVTKKTKLIIINTPHNPIGKIMTQSDMLALEALVQDLGIYVISDEVYEHLVFDGQSHESILKYPGIMERGFAVFSFGKTYHITGWRVGYCIAPKILTEEFRKVHQFNVFTVPTPLQYALADFMKDPAHYEGLPDFFEGKRNFLQNALAPSKLKALSSQGSYFQLYDYSELSDLPDMEFAKLLTLKNGVATIPISVFYSDPDPRQRIVRLCFGKTEQTMQQAAERICAI
jgi:methionine aminotransferase